MKRSRQVEVGIALVLAFVLCACGASARQKTIAATFASTNLAADQLVAFSELHQRAIVDAATTKEEAVTKLAAFRAKVSHAEQTLAAVWRMTAAAAIANDDHSLSALVQVAAILWTELKELGVKVPL